MPTLNNWSITRYSSDPYKAPEQWPYIAQGEISNDVRFISGDRIKTSVLKELNLEEMTVTTRHTTYDLGEPSPKWVEWLQENNYTIEQFVSVVKNQGTFPIYG